MTKLAVTLMKQRLIRNSFLCGLFTFAVNFIFAALKLQFVLLWTANVIPGFVFAFILTDANKSKVDLKSILFILFSGGLYILVAWVATGYSFFGNKVYICFPIASILGATLMLSIYKLFLDNNFNITAGLKYAFLTGIVSSILPVMGDLLNPSFDVLDNSYWLALIFTLSIFIIWQPLFAWTITRQQGYR
jgi:hypothetical protein